MWIGNTTCCWQLLSRVFHTRSFENTRRAAEQDHEMNLRARNSVSGVGHNTTLGRDTMFMHAELAAYLGSDVIVAPRQSLAQDHDTHPALAYRQAHRIE